MNGADGLQLVRHSSEPQIDACDRCLALAQLTAVLCSVPVLRGTPEHDALVLARGTGETDEAGDEPRPEPEPLRPPLVAHGDALAPTPGELVRAAVGVTAVRAGDVARRFRAWTADAARERCAERSLSAVCRCSTDYPEQLRELADPPPVLHIAGDARLIDRCPASAIAMVGTRRPTRVGREAARTIALGIAQSGGIVVSGMALGIDGASHEGALEGRGRTIAVLAGGADRPSPRSHGQLYDSIVATGAVVSELPPGTEPSRWSFPARNRIIAALSEAVIVVEAPLRSGALITVDHANDLGLDVYAVPGSLASPTCQGTNQLLCEGVGGVVDGIDFMSARGRHGRRAGGGDALAGGGDRSSEPPLRPVDPRQAMVHEVLGTGPRTRQELARATTSSLPAAMLEEALSDLELSGWVERGLDGRYALARRHGGA